MIWHHVAYAHRLIDVILKMVLHFWIMIVTWIVSGNHYTPLTTKLHHKLQYVCRLHPFQRVKQPLQVWRLKLHLLQMFQFLAHLSAPSESSKPSKFMEKINITFLVTIHRETRLSVNGSSSTRTISINGSSIKGKTSINKKG